MKTPDLTPVASDTRLVQAQSWLLSLGADLQSGFSPVAGDASFRRYFRIIVDGQSRILMDAPPPGEEVEPFEDIALRLRSVNLHAPEVLHADRRNGYLLLEDLGDKLYRDLLTKDNIDQHMPDLFAVLKNMALKVDTDRLPTFDASLMRTEMDLFPGWYLGHHRKAVPREQFDAIWDGFCSQVIASALAQPQCFVHRDFHSCNLLRTARNTIGIIDFQDAVKGPVSYDLVSLLWDRYIGWPRSRIEVWAETFRHLLELDISAAQWLRYCDLMGLQRNIKVVGIFSRLYYRNGKQGYIEMIPRFYAYILSTLRRYPEYAEMLDLMEHTKCGP